MGFLDMFVSSPEKPEKPKPSESEKALAEIGASQWNYYVSNFVDAEKKLSREARFSAYEAQRTKGSVNTELQAATSAAQNILQKKALSSGVKTSSSAGKMAAAGVNDSNAILGATATSNVGTAGESQETNELLGVLGIGRNKTEGAVQGFSDVGTRQTNMAIAKMNAGLKTSISNRALKSAMWSDMASAVGAMAGSGDTTKDRVDGANSFQQAGYANNQAARSSDGKKYWGYTDDGRDHTTQEQREMDNWRNTKKGLIQQTGGRGFMGAYLSGL